MSKTTKTSLLTHPITGEPQLCFPSGDFVYCNFTIKDGKVYRFSKTKDFIKFLGKWRRKRNSDPEENGNLIHKKEKEPGINRGSNS